MKLIVGSKDILSLGCTSKPKPESRKFRGIKFGKALKIGVAINRYKKILLRPEMNVKKVGEKHSIVNCQLILRTAFQYEKDKAKQTRDGV